MSIPSQQKKKAKQTAKLLSPLMVQKSCTSWDCYFIPLGGVSTSHVVGRGGMSEASFQYLYPRSLAPMTPSIEYGRSIPDPSWHRVTSISGWRCGVETRRSRHQTSKNGGGVLEENSIWGVLKKKARTKMDKLCLLQHRLYMYTVYLFFFVFFERDPWSSR